MIVEAIIDHHQLSYCLNGVFMTENHGFARPTSSIYIALHALHVRLIGLCTPYTCVKHGSARPARAFNINSPNQRACLGTRNCSNKTQANPTMIRRRKTRRYCYTGDTSCFRNRHSTKFVSALWLQFLDPDAKIYKLVNIRRL